MEQIYVSKGNEVIQLYHNKDHLPKMSFEIKHGNSVSTECLKDEMKRREVKQIEYFVVKNGMKRSMYAYKPKKAISETKHTTPDGVKIYHKKDRK